MRKALCALLVICVASAVLIAASHGHLGQGKRCEVCATLHGLDRPAAPPAPGPPALAPTDPLMVEIAAPLRAADILSYSPKNSPPAAA